MGSVRFLLPIFALNLITVVLSQSIIRIPSSRHVSDQRRADYLYCDGWRFSVETNDAGKWVQIPPRCVSFVEEYVTGDRYLSDFEAVARCSLSFARSVEIAGDGKDAWVFDIDETLLTNLPYYEQHGFGSETFDEPSFDTWVDLAEAPALAPSLNLYKELKKLGFTIILLTGRSEHQRNVTEKNLLVAGYTDWERLFLRSPSDNGKLATQYKSEKRMELVQQGFRIHGSSGDQWSDLSGFAVAERSFKLPNPMYYIA